MRIKRREWEELNRKIAALEREQLGIRGLIEKNIEQDEKVIGIEKGYRDDIKDLVESEDADITKQLTDRGER